MSTGSKKMFGLGKGLSSLIPNAKQMHPEAQKENVFYVEINKIRPNPDQPRQDFDQDGLKELSQSIKKYGVLQPLLVSKVEEGGPRGTNVYYQLIAGERRLKASKLAGIPSVPVVIRDDFVTKGARLEVALVENVQRRDLNPVEEAEAYERLSSEFSLTQQEIAQKVGKSREVIANSLRLLGLPKDIKESLRAGVLSRAHARALLAFGDEGKQREVYGHIIGGRLSSKEVEHMASASKPAKSKKSNLTAQEINRFQTLERNLGEMLKVPVLIRSTDSGGHIVIKFATLQELNKVAKRIID
jgi:ParB family transcriptional regulator, chromosome partitioning protein